MSVFVPTYTHLVPLITASPTYCEQCSGTLFIPCWICKMRMEEDAEQIQATGIGNNFPNRNSCQRFFIPYERKLDYLIYT